MQADGPRSQGRAKLALLGAAGSLDLAGHLRAAAGQVLDGEPPPDAASATLSAAFGYRRLSARMGEVGSLAALRQALEAAVAGTLPAHWIWTRKDGRFVDGLRPFVEPEGVASRDEVIALRQAHHVALAGVLAEAEEALILLSGAPGVVDARDGAVYPCAPGSKLRPPAEANLAPHLPDLAALDSDFEAVVRLLRDVNPGLVLRLAVLPMPAASDDVAAGFAAQLPQLRQLSDLRVMMAHWQATLPDVSYLPLFELCTGALAQSGDFSPGAATLTPSGGQEVARLVLGEAVPTAPTMREIKPEIDAQDRKARRAQKRARRSERETRPGSVICEEELLEAFSR